MITGAKPSYLKIFRHPSYHRLVLTTTSLAVLAVPGTRLIAYTPADQATRDAIGCLLAGEGVEARFPCWDAHQRRRVELAATAAAS